MNVLSVPRMISDFELGSYVIIPGSVSSDWTRSEGAGSTEGSWNCKVFPVFRYAKRGFCDTFRFGKGTTNDVNLLDEISLGVSGRRRLLT